MDKNNFTIYLLGQLQKTLLANLPDGVAEDRLLEYAENIIITELEHIRKRIVEAFLIEQHKGGA